MQLVPEHLFVAAQHDAVAQPRWIIDGNSAASLPIRAAAADTIIVLDPHPLACLIGVLSRRVRHHGGQNRSTGVFNRITPGFLRYVLTFRTTHLPDVLRTIREHGPNATVVHLRSRRAVTRLRTTVKREHADGDRR